MRKSQKGRMPWKKIIVILTVLLQPQAYGAVALQPIHLGNQTYFHPDTPPIQGMNENGDVLFGYSGKMFRGSTVEQLPKGVDWSAINDLGVVVGSSNGIDIFSWQNGEVRSLGTANTVFGFDNDRRATVKAINNQGLLGGVMQPHTGDDLPFVGKDGAYWGTFGPTGSVVDINEKGQVVGKSYLSFNTPFWIYENGKTNHLDRSFNNGVARAINDHGQVLLSDGGNKIPIYWENDSLHEFQGLERLHGSVLLTDINNDLDAVGLYIDPATGLSIPVLVTGGSVYDIRDLSSGKALRDSTFTPQFINDKGDISGYARDGSGTSAYLLLATGSQSHANPIPEPQTIWLLLVGLMGIAAQAKRRATAKESIFGDMGALNRLPAPEGIGIRAGGQT